MNVYESPAFIGRFYIDLAFAPRSVNSLPVGAERRDEIPIKLHDSSISIHLNIRVSDNLKQSLREHAQVSTSDLSLGDSLIQRHARITLEVTESPNAANRKAGKLFRHGEALRKWHTSKLGILTATPATLASSLTLARPWLICSRRAPASAS